MSNRGTDIEFACRCGQVEATLSGATRSSVNRSVCYCRDCQAFLHRLERTDLLDERGGTDIVQVAPTAVRIQSGEDWIRGLRLTSKGMYRWFASCCNTPLGNTLEPSIPFIGILAGVVRPSAHARDEAFGSVRARFMTASATYAMAPSRPLASAKMALHIIRLLTSWKLRQRTFPHPFFDASTRRPRFPVDVLDPAERDALRPLTGPNATPTRA